MATYLLLRDNKQKGPFTFEQLSSLGLKPYDLVWVEGRSAAWRYPSEVAELKNIAPVVEEQPYDRFYKKPEELSVSKEEVKQTIAREEIKQTEVRSPNYQKQNEAVNIQPVEKTLSQVKKIFVSLPGSSAGTSKTQSEKPAEQIKEVKREIKEIKSQPWSSYQPDLQKEEPKEIKTPEPNPWENDYKRRRELFEKTKSVSPSESAWKQELDRRKSVDLQKEERSIPVCNLDEDVKLETKFSKPLDEIKEMYVQNLLDKKKSRRKPVMSGMMGTVIIIVLLVGVIIGLVVNNISFGNNDLATLPANTQEQKGLPENEDATKNANNELSLGAINTSDTKNEELVQNDEEQTNTQTSTELTNAIRNTKPLTNKSDKSSSKEKTSEENNSAEFDTPQGSVTNSNGERQRAVRTTSGGTSETQPRIFESEEEIKASLRKQVSVKSNNYRKGTFGGIFDLQLTVNNSSKFVLDEVVVEIQYIKPNGEPLKAEKVRFKAVPAHGTSTLSIPPNNRGTKVNFHILNIRYKERLDDVADSN